MLDEIAPGTDVEQLQDQRDKGQEDKQRGREVLGQGLDLRSRAVTQVDLWEPLTLTLERSDRTYVVDSENLAFTMREPFAGALDGRVAQELESMLSPLRAATIVAKAADDAAQVPRQRA